MNGATLKLIEIFGWGVGVVKQFRKPISNLLSERELIEADGKKKKKKKKKIGHKFMMGKEELTN
jgi:hypothetical protein